MKTKSYPSRLNKMTRLKYTDRELKEEQVFADWHFNRLIKAAFEDKEIL